MKHIIAGPWFGEFGWELIRWQGIFRKIKHNNPGTKIVMVSRPGHKALYEDYIDDYIGIEAVGETDGWKFNGVEPTLGPGLLDKYSDYIYIPPSTCMKMGIDPLGNGQKFIRYGKPYTTKGHDYIVIHPRGTNKCGTEIRNWSIDKWNELVKKISDMGYFVATIGTPSAATLPENTRDMRNIPINNLVDLLYNSKLVIGPSSGPMHLASLCGTPHLVWTDKLFWGSCNGTNRQRYEHNWNPLNTKAHIIDEYDWNPPVEEVYKKIQDILNG